MNGSTLSVREHGQSLGLPMVGAAARTMATTTAWVRLGLTADGSVLLAGALSSRAYASFRVIGLWVQVGDVL